MVVLFYGEELENNVTDEKQQKQIYAIIKSIGEIRSIIEFTGQYQEPGMTASEWQRVDDLFKRREINNMLNKVVFH